MSSAERVRLRDLRLFVTVEHPCSYLPGRVARNLVADPGAMDNRLFRRLAELGFRRSGGYVYRPHCAGCDACRSLRVPVARFRPDRSQRRIRARNRDLVVTRRAARFDAEHYRLFERYLKTRHHGGGMDDASPEGYLSFVAGGWSDTVLYEFRREGKLLAVAVTDRLENALSAVYTFFDPDQSRRSLGTYAILWQIGEARKLGLEWVYLGYWVPGCRKMAYKANFRPHEVFAGGRWVCSDRAAADHPSVLRGVDPPLSQCPPVSGGHQPAHSSGS